jgi:hypothetical protein
LYDIVDYYSKKIRISSPRSLTAMNKLGISNHELEFLTFKDYLEKYPQLIGQDKEMQKIKYNYEEELRKKRFEQIKLIRNELLNEDAAVPMKQRCLSSKERGEKINFNSNNINNKKISNIFLDKDIKYFNYKKINKNGYI